MPKRRERPTQADLIRAGYTRLKERNPSLSIAAAARMLRVNAGAMRSALRSTRAGRGRPPADTVLVRVIIPRSVHDLAKAEAARDGIALEEVLRSAIVSGVVPPNGWTEQMDRDRDQR